jgi:hypothetical protein
MEAIVEKSEASNSWRVWLFRGVGCFRIGVSYVMDCRRPTPTLQHINTQASRHAVDQAQSTADTRTYGLGLPYIYYTAVTCRPESFWLGNPKFEDFSSWDTIL